MSTPESSSARDAIGISLQMVSTFLAALAYVMQKKAHVEIEACGGLHVQGWSHPESKKALWRWRIGFVIMVVCAVLDLLSYPLLDLSKQAPMGAVTLMWNTILASLMLKERFTVLDLMSTCLIVTGTIMSVANSEAESAEFTFPEILDLLKDDLVYGYSAVIITGILVGIYFVEKTTRHPPTKWTLFQKRCISILSPALGGMCMGYTGYGAKALSTVVGAGDWEQMKNPILYLYALLAGVAVTGQLRYLNKGLEFFDALQVVPIFQVFIIFSNAMAGIVYYHDMRHAPGYKLSLFALGGVLCSLGIGIMLLKTARPKGRGQPIAKKEAEDSTATAKDGTVPSTDGFATSVERKGSGSGIKPRSRTSSVRSFNGSPTKPTLAIDVASDGLELPQKDLPSTPLMTGSALTNIISTTSRRRTQSFRTAEDGHFQLDHRADTDHHRLEAIADASPLPDATQAPPPSQADIVRRESTKRKITMDKVEEGGPEEAAPPTPEQEVWYEREVIVVLRAYWQRYFPSVRIPFTRQYATFDA